MVAFARDRAKVKKGGYRTKSRSHWLACHRAKVKKRWIPYEKRKLSEVYTTMFARIEAGLLCTTAFHRNPASMQNRLVRDKPAGYFGFYPRRACM